MRLLTKLSAMSSIFILSAVLLLLPGTCEAISLNSINANSSTIPLYGRYELSFNLTGVTPSNYNPFRPETSGDSLSPAGVDVWADVLIPSGKTVRVNGFWDVDFEYLGQIGSYGEGWDQFDKFVPASDPHWKVRYAPMETGTYRVRVYAKDSTGTASSSEYTFTCTGSDSKGFIRVASDGKRMTYSNGDPYVAIGTSMKDRTGLQNTYLPEMAANGMNFLRRWLVNGNFGDIHRELFPQTWGRFGADYDTTVYRSGKRSVRKAVTGTGMFVEELYVAVRGSEYHRASAYLRTSSDFNGTAAVQVEVYYTDGSRKKFNGNTIGGGSSWTKSSMIFNSGGSGKVADFVAFRAVILSGSTGTVWVDDVELYETDSAGNNHYNWNYLWAPSFEEWSPVQLKLMSLWRAERLLTQCEKYGIGAQLCIFDYRLWNGVDPIGLYTRYLGNFWTDTNSIAQQERVLRYMVARFSAFKSMMAWELTNEMDPNYDLTRENWIRGRAAYIKQIDPQKHIVTNSFWTSPGDVRVTQFPEIDINQVHYYINTEERSGGQGVQTWWGQPSGVVIDRSGSNAHSGTSAMKFTANGSTLGEGQSVYLKPGRPYTLRYWVKTSGVGGGAGALIRFYSIKGSENMSSKSLSNTGTVGYTMREIAFTLPADGCRAHVTLQLTGSSGTAYFDDVQVIDNSTGKDVFYNGGFEAANFGDDEFEWATYNTYLTRSTCESGPNGTMKPWVSGEFGLMGANADLSEWADPTSTFPRHDNTGIHIHNCVWAQLMAGSALHTPSYWWIHEYIIPNNLLGVWKGATTFARSLPFYERGETICVAPYPADIRAESSNSTIRVLGQKFSNSAYLWVQNKGYSWSKIVRSGVNPSPASGTISIPGFTDGSYVVEWYNTVTGAKVRSETISTASGVLRLTVSSLSTDTAAIIKRQASSTSSNIGLQISVDKTEVLPGGELTYTLAYTNSGNDTASNVRIVFPVPDGTEYITGSADNGGQYDSASKSVRWTLTSVVSGGSGQLRARVKVN